MTNEEVYAKVEQEKQHKEQIANMWRVLKCPICGGSDFKTNKIYSMLNVDDFLAIVKGSHVSGADYKVVPIECKECGYVIFKKVK
jgi:predicted Zn-ribbon and HTH transcriptional regulator